MISSNIWRMFANVNRLVCFSCREIVLPNDDGFIACIRQYSIPIVCNPGCFDKSPISGASESEEINTFTKIIRLNYIVSYKGRTFAANCTGKLHQYEMVSTGIQFYFPPKIKVAVPRTNSAFLPPIFPTSFSKCSN